MRPSTNRRSRTSSISATSALARSSSASKNAGAPTANAPGHGAGGTLSATTGPASAGTYQESGRLRVEKRAASRSCCVRTRQVPSQTVFLPRSPASGLTPRGAPGRLTWRPKDSAMPLTGAPGKRKPRGRTAQSKCAMCSASACGYGPARPLAAKSPTVRTHARPVGLRSHRRRC